MQSQVVAEQQRTHAQAVASRALCLAKYRQARSQMRDSQRDVETVLTQLDALFEIVVPKMVPETEDIPNRRTNTGTQMTIDAIGDHHGLGSADYELSVEYRPDRIQESVAAAGEAVKTQIQECLQELVTRYEPVVVDWVESIAAADVEPQERVMRNDLLQSANSLKSRILQAKQKGQHTGLTVPGANEEDDMVFDEEEESEMVVVGFGSDTLSGAGLNDSAGEPAHQGQLNEPHPTGSQKSRKRQKSIPQESRKQRIAKRLKKSAKRVARAMANVDAKQTRGLM